MAKSKEKAKKGMQIRRVKTKKERGGANLYVRLKPDERMVAYALFIPDPEAENNPGWMEYLEHYDNSNRSFLACVGDECYMCELGESPSTKALSLWYFPDNPEKEKIKVFKANGYLIRDFTEIDEEEGGVLGRKFRVKLLDDRGKYRVTPTADKPLTKKEIKELLKDIPDLEELMLNQTKAAIKKADAVDALTEVDDDDDEDDDDEPRTSRRGKPKDEEPEDDDDEDEDEDDDEDDDDDSDDDDDDSEDDDDEGDDEDDDDDDEDDDEDEDEDDDDEEDESASLKSEKFSVVSTSEKDETVTVKIDGKNTKMWLGEGVEADWDAVKKGAEITVDADTDEEGDWVITKLKVAKAKDKGGKGKSKGGKKK